MEVERVPHRVRYLGSAIVCWTKISKAEISLAEQFVDIDPSIERDLFQLLPVIRDAIM